MWLVRKVFVEFLLPFVVGCMLTLFSVLVVNTVLGIFANSFMRNHPYFIFAFEMLFIAISLTQFFLYFQKFSIKTFSKGVKKHPS
jgi:hypothetical protein